MKLLVSAILLTCACTALLAQHPDDYRWDGRFGAPGILPIRNYSGVKPSPVQALAADGDVVYAGGEFTSAGRNIAAWNVKTGIWSELGAGVGGAVKAIALDGDNVYVAGVFTEAGGVAARNIAVWNKRTGAWSALGKGIAGEVRALAIYKGELFAGGGFGLAGDVGANNIARWNGTAWQTLGSGAANGAINGSVLAMTEYAGELWVGGNFAIAGGNPAIGKLARWDGATWKAVAGVGFKTSSFQTSVNSFAVAGARLFVAGSWYWDSLTIGGVARRALGLIQYDGNQWSEPVQSFGQNGNSVPLICAAGDDLYICANIQEVNGILAKGTAKLNIPSGQWSALGGGISNSYTLAGICVAGGNVIVGGEFTEAGGQFVNNIAAFDIAAQQWKPLGGGTALGILLPTFNSQSLRLVDDGQTTIAFGAFDYAANTRVNGLARWNGSTWTPVGTGLFGGLSGRRNGLYLASSFIASVISLGGQNLLLGGDFTGAGGTSAAGLITFDGSTFKEYGGGVSGEYLQQGSSSLGTLNVSALLRDGAYVYAAGTFKQAGITAAANIARWDGQQWNDMAGGISFAGQSGPPSVSTLVRSPQGDIFAGGFFSHAGGVPVAGLARWDGQRWSNIGTDTIGRSFGQVSAILFVGGDIYIGGEFLQRGGKVVRSIARWDGQQWNDLAGGLGSSFGSYGTVNVLAVKGDDLYVGGSFVAAGDVPAQNIAVWNMRSQTWRALGSGVNVREIGGGGGVRSIVFRGDTLLISGVFDQAGGKPSFNVAAWLPAGASSVEQTNADMPDNFALTIAPNPLTTNGTFEFHLKNSSNIRLVLADALGREVLTIAEGEYTAGSYRASADVSLLPAGVYVARLLTAGGATAQTAIIQR